MTRVMGIDPGTRTWDVVGVSNGTIGLEKTLSSEKVKKHPELILQLIDEFNPELISAPSGYGLPLKRITDLNDNDIFLITLKKEKNEQLGLTKVLSMMIKEKVNGYILPSVKHLPTVPQYRKFNRIDMGTPDKLCSAILGIEEYSTGHNIPYNEVSFILAEIGSAFNAFIAVDRGKIVDGIGGSLASSGFMSLGRMDSEMAYLLGGFEKGLLFRGGVSDGKKAPEEYFRGMRDESMENFIDGIIKDISAVSVSVPGVKRVLFSGRISRISEFMMDTKTKLPVYFSLELLEGNAKASNAAEGAAMIADGLAGGKHHRLVEHVELRKTAGSVLDGINLQLGF